MVTESVRDRVVGLRRVRANELMPHPKNAREHPESQRNALRAVMSQLGFAGAILAVERDGKLLVADGHLRTEEMGDREVPVLVLDLNDAEVETLLLTYDPIGAMAKTNKDRLAALLQTYETSRPQVGEGMLAELQDGLNKMLAGLASRSGVKWDGGVEVMQDEVPLPPDTATTEQGDVWCLGRHRLKNGNSSNPDDLDHLLAGAVIDLVNMDPPYNVKVEPRSNNAIAAGLSSFQASNTNPQNHHQGLDLARHPGKSKPTQKKLRAKDRPLANDFVTDDSFDVMLDEWFGNASRVLKPGGSFYIWGGYANIGNYPAPIKRAGLYFSQGIVWDKQHPVLTRKDFMGAFEIAFYGWKEGAGHEFYGPNNVTDLWHVKKVTPQSMVHLPEKPVELAVLAMEYSSKPGDTVLDLFGGSGSTLMGAEQCGRKAFLMELDPLYCDVILQRYLNFTKQEPVLEATGETFTQVKDRRAAERAQATPNVASTDPPEEPPPAPASTSQANHNGKNKRSKQPA
jgi:DNA modification methylase